MDNNKIFETTEIPTLNEFEKESEKVEIDTEGGK